LWHAVRRNPAGVHHLEGHQAAVEEPAHTAVAFRPIRSVRFRCSIMCPSTAASRAAIVLPVKAPRIATAKRCTEDPPPAGASIRPAAAPAVVARSSFGSRVVAFHVRAAAGLCPLRSVAHHYPHRRLRVHAAATRLPILNVRSRPSMVFLLTRVLMAESVLANQPPTDTANPYTKDLLDVGRWIAPAVALVERVR